MIKIRVVQIRARTVWRWFHRGVVLKQQKQGKIKQQKQGKIKQQKRHVKLKEEKRHVKDRMIYQKQKQGNTDNYTLEDLKRRFLSIAI